MVGTKIAHYEITGRLGEGGMGEVWRARDTQLKREVALKVLAPALLGDVERTQRMRREAEVLASLADPHIAAIFGLEEHDGSLVLVLELVEGPTLHDRIQMGPLPWRDAARRAEIPELDADEIEQLADIMAEPSRAVSVVGKESRYLYPPCTSSTCCII